MFITTASLKFFAESDDPWSRLLLLQPAATEAIKKLKSKIRMELVLSFKYIATQLIQTIAVIQMVVRIFAWRLNYLLKPVSNLLFNAQTAQMKRIFFFFVAICFGFASVAQLQLGVFGGLSNYQGDLVDKLYKSSKGAFGFTVGYPVSSRVTLRANLTFAKVAGADSLTSQQDLKLRNLNFQSPITEFGVRAEINTFDLEVKAWSPYVFAGLAVYHFNPYTFDQNGNKIFLQPLSTEGQGLPGYGTKPYPLTQLAIPFGGGIKYNVGDHVQFAFEIGLRKLFTDYLDDVSGNYANPNDLFQYKGQQAVDLSYRGDEVPGGDPVYPAKGYTRGSPKYKDYYYFTGLHLIFTLPDSGNSKSFSSAAGKRKGYGCPTRF